MVSRNRYIGSRHVARADQDQGLLGHFVQLELSTVDAGCPYGNLGRCGIESAKVEWTR